uniref:Cytochrome b n=1 Tax=Sacculina sp. 'Beibu Gulf' TaxID=2861897 RepID=A0A8F9W8K7_9CRUS|nr:cytochrome b [Sacculina sp. 'Beibu Gulf']
MFIKNLLLNNPSPSSLSYFWNFGSLLLVNLLVQILSGFLLSFHYSSSIELSFSSVNNTVMNINSGWIMRYIHMNGASMFFILIYLHIGRGLYFGSYMNYSLWLSGLLILIILFMIAFIGYVLPWGQMSFWGATVITSLITALPYLGDTMVNWIWGGYSVGGATLTRFFSLHFILPFILFFLVLLHIIILHDMGSNNPLGFNNKTDKIRFHPYFMYKDFLGFIFYFMFLVLLFSLLPVYFGDSENFIMANPMVTPPHIKPEWYYLFAYAILRSIPSKLGGVLALMMSIIIIIVLPFLDTSEFSSLKFYFWGQFTFWLMVMSFFMLTWLGGELIETPYVYLSKMYTMIYFSFFLFINKLKISVKN